MVLTPDDEQVVWHLPIRLFAVTIMQERNKMAEVTR